MRSRSISAIHDAPRCCLYSLDFGRNCGWELGKPDIQEFLKPKQAVEHTKVYWSGEMPTEVIGFASDCMGNMIGFRRQSASSDDSPVVFFDHDYVEASEIFPSFDEFLAWYLDNLK